MRLVIASSIACVMAGCHHVAETPDASTVDALPRQTVTDKETLLSGMLLEGSWNAGPNDHIGLSLSTSTATFDWDIHGHAGGGTQEIASGFAQMTVSYDFKPTQEAQWYLLLRNSSSSTLTIDISMDLFGQAQWIGWQ